MLAERLGMPVAQVLGLSAVEVAHWQAYYRKHPWGEARADLRMGILASLIANIASSMGKKRGSRFKPADFIPSFGTTESGSPDLASKFKGFFAGLGINLKEKGTYSGNGRTDHSKESSVDGE